MIHAEILQLVGDLVCEYRFRRQDALERELGEVVGQANATGRLRSGFLIADLERHCAAELTRRCDDWLKVMDEVVDAADLRVEGEVVNALTGHILKELMSDSDEVYEIYRQKTRVASEDPGISKLEGARTRARRYAEQRIRLLGLRQRARQPPLEEQLRAPRYDDVRAAWTAAVKDQKEGHVRSAARNAVGAVEELARIATQQGKATLGSALSEVKRSDRFSPHLVNAIERLWAFRSDTPGLGHGSGDGASVSVDELAVVMVLSQAGLTLFLAFDRT